MTFSGWLVDLSEKVIIGFQVKGNFLVCSTTSDDVSLGTRTIINACVWGVEGIKSPRGVAHASQKNSRKKNESTRPNKKTRKNMWLVNVFLLVLFLTSILPISQTQPKYLSVAKVACLLGDIQETPQHWDRPGWRYKTNEGPKTAEIRLCRNPEPQNRGIINQQQKHVISRVYRSHEPWNQPQKVWLDKSLSRNTSPNTSWGSVF